MTVRKIAITVPEEMYEVIERARKHEHRSRSEFLQEAVRSHLGEPVYRPTDEERHAIDDALADLRHNPDAGSSWEEVRRERWPHV